MGTGGPLGLGMCTETSQMGPRREHLHVCSRAVLAGVGSMAACTVLYCNFFCRTELPVDDTLHVCLPCAWRENVMCALVPQVFWTTAHCEHAYAQPLAALDGTKQQLIPAPNARGAVVNESAAPQTWEGGYIVRKPAEVETDSCFCHLDHQGADRFVWRRREMYHYDGV